MFFELEDWRDSRVRRDRQSGEGYRGVVGSARVTRRHRDVAFDEDMYRSNFSRNVRARGHRGHGSHSRARARPSGRRGRRGGRG